MCATVGSLPYSIKRFEANCCVDLLLFNSPTFLQCKGTLTKMDQCLSTQHEHSKCFLLHVSFSQSHNSMPEHFFIHAHTPIDALGTSQGLVSYPRILQHVDRGSRSSLTTRATAVSITACK